MVEGRPATSWLAFLIVECGVRSAERGMQYMKTMRIMGAMGVVAWLGCGVCLGQDMAGRTIRYRANSVLSFDSTAKIQDEGGSWSMGATQLGKLAMIQSGTATFGDFTITAHVVVTNVPSDGLLLVVNGAVRTWGSNAVASASALATGSSTVTTATNLFSDLTNYGLAGPISVGSVSNQVVRFTGFTNQVMAVTASGWATVVLTTNTLNQATAVFSPAYSSPPAVFVSAGTNDLPHVMATTTNYALLGAATTNHAVKWLAIGPP
jgi:hypothetical protein